MLDKLNLMSDEQALTTTAASTSYIDQLAAGDAVGRELEAVVLVKTALTGGTSVNFQLQTDTDSAFGTAVTLAESGAVVAATLVAGYKWRIRIPKGAKRYLRINYTISGSFSAGAVTAYLTDGTPVDIND